MYFAIDPAYPSVPAEIFEALCTLRAHSTEPLALFALIDAAFDEALLANRRWIRQPKFSLYEHTALHGLAAAGPHLVPAPVEPGDQPSWLRDIFAACAGRPMLSILASALPAAALRMHLRPYLVARTPDGMEWPVRWGDSRVLPAVLEALEAPQREHLLSPLQYWWSISRDGTLTSWHGGASPSPAPASFDRLPLSDAVFSHLVDLAETDAIIADIHDTQPDLLRRHGGAASHARVAQHLGLASQHGITAAGARQHFSVLALCREEDFATHPARRAVLDRTREGADYRTEIAALPARFWQDAAPK